MRLAALCLPVVLISSPAWSQETIQGAVHFTVVNAGVEVSGSMKLKEIRIQFDPRDLKQSKIAAIADPSTIQTGIEIRDNHLKRSDFFDVKEYPVISLESKSLRGKKEFTGEFELIMKGNRKVVSIPFQVTRTPGGFTYQGKFEINRMDFHLGDKSLTLSEKVIIAIKATVLK